MKVAVEVRNLYYSYGEGYVLRNVSLTIRRGEIVAIMGENGAGKTTLIKHLNGLLKPTSGYVKVLGFDTRTTAVEELARYVGIVFQNPDHQLFAETVEKEIMFAMKNFGFSDDVIKRRVEWALKIMGLEKYKDRSPFSLSVGERKRLAIASVLSYDPEVIILDEPTAGQDAIQKEKISELMNLLRFQRKTVIMVTHDVEFVLQRVDRVILMSRGEVIADGPLRRILTNVELLKRARLLPPQITQTAYLLKLKGLIERHDVLYPEELISNLLGGVK